MVESIQSARQGLETKHGQRKTAYQAVEVVHGFDVDNVAAAVLFVDLDMALTEATGKSFLLGDDAWAGCRR